MEAVKKIKKALFFICFFSALYCTIKATKDQQIKDFVSEQAKICGIDPQSIDIEVKKDVFCRCKLRTFPLWMGIGNKPCIQVNPQFKPGIFTNFYKSNDYGSKVIFIRHELGHAEQEAQFIAKLVRLGTALGLFKVIDKSILKIAPKNIKGIRLLSTAASFGMTYGLSKYVSYPLYNKWCEASADNFAIDHSSEKEYLLATAKYFNDRHLARLQKLKEESKASIPKQLLLKAIERYPYLIEISYNTHPSDFSRAQKFSAAAKAIECKDQQ